jgi:hypothetical protein
MSGSWFRGRGLAWDPDRQALELERQRWVMERVGPMNEAIVDLSVDPAEAYQAHRREYERTGDLAQLRLALEYVQP